MKFNELINIINFQGELIKESGSFNTKLVKGYEHNKKTFSKIQKELVLEPLQNKKFELALVGQHKEILINEKGNYLFDKEGYKQIEEFSKELTEQIVDFEFYKTKFTQLTDSEKALFFNIEENTYSITLNKDTYLALQNFISDLPEKNFDDEDLE